MAAGLLADNPIFAHEVPSFWRQASAVGRVGWLTLYVVLALLPVGLILYYWDDLAAEIAMIFLGLIITGLGFFLPVLAPALTAGEIAGERERRSWDLLVLTRLTAGQILFGKLLARLIPLGLILLAVCPTLLLLGTKALPAMLSPSQSHIPIGLGATSLGGMVLVFVQMIFLTFANAVVGLYISFRSSGTRAALLVAYGIAFLGYLASSFIEWGIFALGMYATFGFNIMSPSPINSRSYEMWSWAGSLIGPAVWVVVWLAILLPNMVRHFDSIDNRFRNSRHG